LDGKSWGSSGRIPVNVDKKVRAKGLMTIQHKTALIPHLLIFRDAAQITPFPDFGKGTSLLLNISIFVCELKRQRRDPPRVSLIVVSFYVSEM